MAPEVRPATPPYVQVADEIRRQIVSGKLQPGEAIPSVRELSAEWDIARATAEKAVGLLKAQGLVTSRPGASTVVNFDLPIHRSVQDRYEQIRQTGLIYTPGEHAKITAADLMPAPEDVAAALNVPPGSPVVRRQRVTYSEDVPVSSSTSWFTATVGAQSPLLLERTRIRQGTSRYVEETTGRTLAESQDQVTSRLATPEEASALALPLPAAVLETRHTAWDSHGEPLTYEVGLARPGRVTTYHHTIRSKR